jgi:hypothetical protein
MFSSWIVTYIVSARGTLYCRKTSTPCGNQLVICELYVDSTKQEAPFRVIMNLQYASLCLLSSTVSALFSNTSQFMLFYVLPSEGDTIIHNWKVTGLYIFFFVAWIVDTNIFRRHPASCITLLCHKLYSLLFSRIYRSIMNDALLTIQA